MESSKKDIEKFEVTELMSEMPLIFSRQLEIEIDAHGASYEMVNEKIMKIFEEHNGDCTLRLKISNVNFK